MAESEPMQQPGIPAGRVFRAASGMLYLAGGSNGAAALHTAAGFAQRIDAPAWQRRLVARRTAVEAAGSRFVQLIVPEKLSIYPLGPADRQALFPGSEAGDIAPPGLRLMQTLPPGLALYPDERLRTLRAKFAVYPATDSHWSWRGAYAAFASVMEALGRAPDARSFAAMPRQTLRYHGDLWEPAFADLGPDEFQRVSLPTSARRVYINGLVGMKEQLGLENEGGLHAGSHCVFHNCAAEFDETVILFGSSFSESRPEASLLTAAFVHHFACVHFLWSTNVDMDYVARHRPQVTVAEVPERFLTECPGDAVSVEAYAAERTRAWLQRPGPPE